MPYEPPKPKQPPPEDDSEFRLPEEPFDEVASEPEEPFDPDVDFAPESGASSIQLTPQLSIEDGSGVVDDPIEVDVPPTKPEGKDIVSKPEKPKPPQETKIMQSHEHDDDDVKEQPVAKQKVEDQGADLSVAKMIRIAFVILVLIAALGALAFIGWKAAVVLCVIATAMALNTYFNNDIVELGCDCAVPVAIIGYFVLMMLDPPTLPLPGDVQKKVTEFDKLKDEVEKLRKGPTIATSTTIKTQKDETDDILKLVERRNEKVVAVSKKEGIRWGVVFPGDQSGSYFDELPEVKTEGEKLVLTSESSLDGARVYYFDAKGKASKKSVLVSSLK